MTGSISRRDFLKLAGAGFGLLAFRPLKRILPLSEFPESERLGRNCTGGTVEIKSHPDGNSPTTKVIYEDAVLPWLREVVGNKPNYINQRWVETPEGYIYLPYLQPVRNQPNTPLTGIPDGRSGFWAEVSVPFVDLFIDNPPPRSPWAKDIIALGSYPRLYFSQVMWIDQIALSSAGRPLYRISEGEKRGYGYGDIFWADGAAFRPLTEEETAPIRPDIDPAEKRITVNVTNQFLSCFEGKREVFFCRVSTGAKYYASGAATDKWVTPLGEHITWRKAISLHMAGGTTGAGFDTPGVSWTTVIVGEGVAIHSAFWHNDFGVPRSHGCINCRPEEAKWIFRWTTPVVTQEEGDVTLNDWRNGGSTHVTVEERYW